MNITRLFRDNKQTKLPLPRVQICAPHALQFKCIVGSVLEAKNLSLDLVIYSVRKLFIKIEYRLFFQDDISFGYLSRELLLLELSRNIIPEK